MECFDNLEFDSYNNFDFSSLNPEAVIKNESLKLFHQIKADDNNKNNTDIDITNKNTICTLNLNKNIINENLVDSYCLNENKNKKLNKNDIFKNKPKDKSKKKILGRKRKDYKEISEHNKYSEDNIIRKIKSTLLNFLSTFINSFIYEKYNGRIGEGIFKKEILKINQDQIIKDKNNKEFINKTIKDIFSNKLSGKYTNFDSEHNKKLIEFLINKEKDEEKKISFRKLFNLTFMDSLNHFSGIKQIPILNGMKLLKDLCKKFEEDRDYVNLLKYNTYNFEKIIMDKKNRNRTKKN